MERITYLPDMHQVPVVPAGIITPEWRDRVPVLSGAKVTLRELDIEDAMALFALLTTEQVSRFISPPPPTVEGFERFIMRSQRERASGRQICFAVVPNDMNTAIGLFQLRQIEAGFASAEWGFAIGSDFWGTGMFADGARMVVDYAVETIGVHRLEARAAVINGRGNGALRKIGAIQEGILRQSFTKNGQKLDQVLWSILAEDWRQAKAGRASKVVH